jgi:hypothetical protein
LPTRALGAWAVAATYVAVFMALGAPWLGQFAAGVPIAMEIGRADTRLVVWILWWVAYSLLHDPAGILDAPISYPAPHQLTGSEHFATVQLVFLPAFAATGNVVLATNALLLASYPLAAFAMNRLLVAEGFAPLVAWIIGFMFALGALQVPADVHMLQTFPVYPAAAALALKRLREKPDAVRSIALAAVLVLAFFTAYYTVAIVVPVVLVWGIAELARRLPARRRFALLATTILAVCLALLATVSRPYLSHASTEASFTVRGLAVADTAVILAAYLSDPVHLFGATTLLLALFGLLGLLDPSLRRIAVIGLLLVLTSAFFISGAPRAVLAFLPPSPVRELLGLPVTFFRVVIRYAAIASFGLSLLAAVALQLAVRYLGRRTILVLLTAVAAATVYERGSVLFLQEYEASAAANDDVPVYREVRRITSERGRGPLLELPTHTRGYSLEPESMIGSIQHNLPLIVGHTGYVAAHTMLVEETIRRLPAEEAVQDLVDMTRLRWLLLRPGRYWGGARRLAAFREALLAVPGVGPAWSIDGWTLIELDREPRHPSWFDAIRAGPRCDRSLLGTPLSRPLDDGIASSIDVGEQERADGVFRVPVDGALALRVRVQNGGPGAWAIVLPPAPEVSETLRLLVRWRAVEGDVEVALPSTTSVPLPRDVPAGESVAVDLRLQGPKAAGLYELELCLTGGDGRCLPGERNPSRKIMVKLDGDTISPAARTGPLEPRTRGAILDGRSSRDPRSARGHSA